MHEISIGDKIQFGILLLMFVSGPLAWIAKRIGKLREQSKAQAAATADGVKKITDHLTKQDLAAADLVKRFDEHEKTDEERFSHAFERVNAAHIRIDALHDDENARQRRETRAALDARKTRAARGAGHAQGGPA